MSLPDSVLPFVANTDELAVPMRVRRDGFLGTSESDGVCTQLTPSGLVAEVPAVLYVGELVKVELQLSDEPVRVDARVTYRNHFRYGFYFPTALHNATS